MVGRGWHGPLVVYDDELAHCGDGKRLVARPAAADMHRYCSAFVGLPGVSWRRLQLGRHVFWVEYTSATSWMSNVGPGGCEVIGVELDRGLHPVVRLPLWAADFAVGDELYAVDFNVAPGVRGSGVEKLLDAAAAHDALDAAVRELAVELA